MALIEVKTGEERKIEILPIDDKDYKALTKKRYFFSWKPFKLRSDTTLYKLRLPDGDDILGVMALMDFPREERSEICLLACSLENVGKNKTYEGITGHLIAYACRRAVKQYGPDACVSLLPKTELRRHYMEKYGMSDSGLQVFLEGNALTQLILKYLL